MKACSLAFAPGRAKKREGARFFKFRIFASMIQQIIVYALVAGSVAFLGFRFFKPASKDNCDKDCNCG